MAADLERATGEIQAERDKVASLLQSRRELIANVSHELRTPVATIRGYLEPALAGDAQEPSELRHDLEVMAREVERLQGLIDEKMRRRCIKRRAAQQRLLGFFILCFFKIHCGFNVDDPKRILVGRH